MIELVFTACLLAAPADCKDVHLMFDGAQLTPMACLMAGQPQIAEWAVTHPGWRVTRYRCGLTREARIAI